MNLEEVLGLQVLVHREREPRIVRTRIDPRETMSDTEFKRHFRFRLERIFFFFSSNSILNFNLIEDSKIIKFVL